MKKTEKAFMAMNLIVINPLFQSLPLTVSGGFQSTFSEIKTIRDSANECRETDEIDTFSFDLTSLEIKCAKGLKAEVLLRSLLAQMAMP